MALTGANMKLEGQGPGLFNAGGGTIELLDNAVVIQKKNTDMSGTGFLDMAINLATSTRGGYTAAYDAIHSVNISEGGFMSPPFIQVLTAGEKSVSSSEDAAKTPSCLLFKKAALGQFKALKAEIEGRVADAKRKPAPSAPAPSLADELTKLAALLSAGHLTQAEFDQQKAQLLSRA